MSNQSRKQQVWELMKHARSRTQGARTLLLAAIIAAGFIANGDRVSAAPSAMKGSVRMFNGRPTIFINETPEIPQVYALTDFLGGRFTWEEVPKRNIEVFSNLGVRLFQVDIWFEDIWPQSGKLDMELVKRQVRGVTDVNPNAAVFIRFHVNAPFWWNQKHPEECVTYANGPADSKVYGPPLQIHYRDTERSTRHSLASERWKNDATPKFKEMMKALASSREGRNVVGLQVAGGVYGEWHPWGFPSNEQDTSAPMTQYFHRWLGAKYKTDAALAAAWDVSNVTLATATVPDLAARNRTLDGMFRAPAKERQVMDYYEAQQDTIADAILGFSEVIKTTWPRPIIVGAFYGYYFSTFGRQAAGAHLRMSRVFNSKWVDYISAPQSYFGESREMGGAGQSRSLVESGRLAGKLFLDEMDTRTHLTRPGDGDEPSDPKNAQKFSDDVALLRRNTIHPLLRGHGLWYYDFGAVFASGSWDHPVFHQELRQLRTVLSKAWQTPYEPTADVLVVYDPGSVIAMHSLWNTINNSLIDQLSAAVYRSGAVGDFVRLEDLSKVNLDHYKAILFAHTTRISPEDRAVIRDKVAKNGRHLLWTYMPGYFDGESTNEANVSAVTGIQHTRIKFPGTPKDDPTMMVDGKGFPATKFSITDPVQPMLAVTDPKAESVAHLVGSQHIMVAKKTLPESTAWVGTLGLHDANLLRSIFRQAGAHIYLDDNDSVLAGMNLLMINTIAGGKRVLHLRNGRNVEVTIPPRSTSLFSAETGESLLTPTNL
jgi:hypothetical protein